LSSSRAGHDVTRSYTQALSSTATAAFQREEVALAVAIAP
jgi:hypothetical protein